MQEDLYGGGGSFPPDSWDMSGELAADVSNLSAAALHLTPSSNAHAAARRLFAPCQHGCSMPNVSHALLPTDDEDPFLRLPKQDGDKDGKDGLDAAVALRAKPVARRGPGFFALLPPGRQPSELAAAAAAAAAAAEAAARSSAAAKALQQRAAKLAASKAQGTANQAQPGGDQHAAAQAQAQQAPETQQPAQQQESRAEGQRTALPRTVLDRLQAALEGPAAQKKDVASGAEAATAPTAADASQPAASVVASRPPAATDGTAAAAAGAAAVPGLALPAASVAPAVAPGAAAPAAAGKMDPSVAASKPGAPLLKRGDRVTYRGKVHPSFTAAQERLDQLQQAISRVEASASSRAREYLPQLLVSLVLKWCCILVAAVRLAWRAAVASHEEARRSSWRAGPLCLQPAPHF